MTIARINDCLPAAAALEPPSALGGAADPVRVLVVGPVTAVGGMGTVTRQTVGSFDRSRFDVAVCDVTKDTPPGRSLATAGSAQFRRWRRLVRMLRSHHPHVVYFHTCSFNTFYRTALDALTCRVLRFPYVLHIHGGEFADFLRSLRGLRRSVVQSVLRHAARVVVLSGGWRKLIAELASGARLSVVANGVETGEPADSAARGGGVLMVGDLSELKRPEDALVAYASLPATLTKRFPLTIVGGESAERREHLEELARRLGVSARTTFTGPVPGTTVRKLMRRADVLLLPSRAECMPVVLLEAMAEGLPAVATAVGSVPEMVTDGVEAALVAPLDPPAMSRRLAELLGDERLRQTIGQAARLRAETSFSLNRFRSAVAALWADVAEQAGLPSAPPVPRLATSTFRIVL